jgi:hypothetical protein
MGWFNVLDDEEEDEGHLLEELVGGGDCAAGQQLVAQVGDGQGLLEVFEEAVGLELVEGAPLGLVHGVDLGALVDDGPQRFGLAREGGPEPVEEPHGLLLVRELRQRLQLLHISRRHCCSLLVFVSSARLGALEKGSPVRNGEGYLKWK